MVRFSRSRRASQPFTFTTLARFLLLGVMTSSVFGQTALGGKNQSSSRWISGFSVGFGEAAKQQKFALIFWHAGRADDVKLRTQLNTLALEPAFRNTIFVDVDCSKEQWQDLLWNSPGTKPFSKSAMPVVSIVLPGKMNAQQMESPAAPYFFSNVFREIARSAGLVPADEVARRLLPGMCAELLHPDPENVFRVTDPQLKSKCSRRSDAHHS